VLIIAIAVCALGVLNRSLADSAIAREEEAAARRRVQAAEETRELVSTNGNITFAAFEALCRNRGLTDHSREAMRAAFDEADADKSDTIDKAEVEKLIAGMLRVEAPPPAPSSPLAPFSPSSPGAHTVMSLTRFSQTVARSPQPSLIDSPSSAPAPPSRVASSVWRSGSGRLSLN